jgi:hypothetical protein
VVSGAKSAKRQFVIERKKQFDFHCLKILTKVTQICRKSSQMNVYNENCAFSR